MSILKRWLEFIISLPKIVWINFSSLPIRQAIKLPIYVHYNVIFKNKGKIIFLDDNISRFSVVFGKQGSFHIAPKKSIVVIHEGGELKLGSDILLSSGVSLNIERNASVTIGNGVSFNRNASIFSKYLVEIGNDCLFGWNVSIRDNDGHYIDYPDKVKKNNNYIKIGEHSWIAAECLLMKGTQLKRGAVVGTRSMVNKTFETENVLLVGSPAKVIKRNVTWTK